MLRAFKLFGLPRTGTNLMRHLMLENFHVESIEKGTEWKHGWIEQPFRQRDGRAVIFIVCVKNPLAWLWSCFQYFQRARGIDSTVPETFRPGMPFPEFLRMPAYGFPNAVHRWNVMNRHWLTYLPDGFVVRHEDVLGEAEQRKTLRAVANRFDLEGTRALAGIERRVNPDLSVGEAMNREFYQARQYVQHFHESDLAWLRSECFWDAELLQRLDYQTWI